MARFELVDIELLCPVCRGDMPLLSLRIAARRRALGLKNYPLARQLGIDARTLARLGRAGPPRKSESRHEEYYDEYLESERAAAIISEEMHGQTSLRFNRTDLDDGKR